MGKKKKEIIQLDRESVIPILKPRLIQGLTQLIENKLEREEFLTFCKRQLHTLFEPVVGAKKLEERDLSEDEIDELEQKFLVHLFQMMSKSNFKIVSNQEIEVAASGKYCLNLPIKVDESKLDSTLLRRYFSKHPQDHLPYFADQYIIFRRGFGLDQMTAYFIQWKIDALISRAWQGFLRLTGLRRFFSRRRRARYVGNQEQQVDIDSEDEEDGDDDGDEHDLFIERIRIQNMNLSIRQLISQTTIQEPTFEKIIIIYRLLPKEADGSKKADGSKEADSRAIYVKHFKNIPMADMEIVLPEKKNPGLTPLDWVKFLVTAAIGLVTVITQLCKTKANIRVLAPICSAVVGYCAKIYFTFQKNLSAYQSLITRSMYEKQLDSGRGTLLHLCDDVIHQEVKEVIVAFFVLMKYGKFTRQDLDRKCEELILEQYTENCNFDVDDAIHKLEKLGIVHKVKDIPSFPPILCLDQSEQYSSVDVKKANDFIGTTTEEIVTNASQNAQ
ncbi:uncharacterized protein LOC104897658 isoform X3 [Beta vulgaris subsp. vulgaris]|uniref:uncharacterized protein LOC104897658 isoform X3 n=1 Tax=Beta vulgaris subsp. vulgaris TaxID=3555 RepID=UPI002036A493|nr:uncharacterized protein LOC104897658 isoform X3 [Beta vulgaris subsp. vulgaris]